MTPVEFLFLTPEGVPIPDALVEIQLSRASFDNEDTGVIMPRLVEARTNERGEVTVNLQPLPTSYYATVEDTMSDAVVYYEFLVPEIQAPVLSVRLQDIVIVGPISEKPYDEVALALIQDAKVHTMASMVEAREAANLARESIHIVTEAKDTTTVLAGQALASKNSAAASAETALQAKTDAEAAIGAIVDAKNTAVAAKDTAVAQATIATTKAGEASASATAAATSKTGADSAKTAAETAKTAAAGSATAAGTSATTASTKAGEASTSATTASTKAAEAAASALAAKSSEDKAKTSETNAGTSASTATTKATEAANSATNAATSKTGADTAKTAAETAKGAAEAANTAAQSAKTASATSATNAKASEDAAKASETAANTSKVAAAGSATAAGTSATNSYNSSIAAGTSQTNAGQSASAASVSAQAALDSKNAAATSASTATGAATTATTAKDAANVSALASEESNQGALASKEAAAASATAAATSAGNALTQADRSKTEADRAQAAADEATTGQVNADWNATEGKAVILNKPNISQMIADNALPAGTNLQYLRGDKVMADFAPAVRATALIGFSTANSASVTATDTLLSSAGKLQAQMNARAQLASPTFTGTPKVPVPAAGTNTTQIAPTSWVLTEIASAVNALVSSAPGTLDTLNELAAALGNDPNFATTMTNAIAAKADAASVTASLGDKLDKAAPVANGSLTLKKADGTGGYRFDVNASTGGLSLLSLSTDSGALYIDQNLQNIEAGYGWNFKGNLKGNADSATLISGNRKINGVVFDGSKDITILASDNDKLPLTGGGISGELRIGNGKSGQVRISAGTDYTWDNALIELGNPSRTVDTVASIKWFTSPLSTRGGTYWDDGHLFVQSNTNTPGEKGNASFQINSLSIGLNANSMGNTGFTLGVNGYVQASGIAVGGYSSTVPTEEYIRVYYSGRIGQTFRNPSTAVRTAVKYYGYNDVEIARIDGNDTAINMVGKWKITAATYDGGVMQNRGYNLTGSVSPILYLGETSSATVVVQAAGSITIDTSKVGANSSAMMTLALVNGAAFALTWNTQINWIMADASGNTTTNFNAAGYTLKSSGEDLIVFIFANGRLYGKVVR